MKKRIALALLAVALVVGCGVKKEFVNQQVADAESRTNARLESLTAKTDANGTDLTKLQQLALDLSRKTDMAINNAAGFEKYQIIWQGEINFPFDSYELDGIAEGILSDGGQKMQGVPQSIIEISGHTDATGSKSYNYMLGEKRANSTKRYLAEKFGIGLYRMFIISYGNDKPVAMPDEHHANAKNRRVTLKVWAPPTGPVTEQQ